MSGCPDSPEGQGRSQWRRAGADETSEDDLAGSPPGRRASLGAHLGCLEAGAALGTQLAVDGAPPEEPLYLRPALPPLGRRSFRPPGLEPPPLPPVQASIASCWLPARCSASS